MQFRSRMNSNSLLGRCVALPAALLLCWAPAGLHAANNATAAANAPCGSSQVLSQGFSRMRLECQIGVLLSAPEIARDHWGISATTLDGHVVYALNDSQLFAPASNAKLCTTAAALSLLGGSATTTTRVLGNGPLDSAGNLHGDLVLQGNGDASISGRIYPYLSHTERTPSPLAALTALADQVVAHGLHSVTGNIVGDDTAFPFERYGSGWAWDDLEWGYGAPVSALTVSDNVVYLNLFPGAAAGDPTTVSFSPSSGDWIVDNTSRTSAAGTEASLGVDRQPGTKLVRIFGTTPAAGNGAHLALAIEDPAEFAASAFRQMLIARGVQVSGEASARHRWSIDTTHLTVEQSVPVALPKNLPAAPTPLVEADATGMVLATRTSVPLLEDVTVTNKASQNLHAELMLRLLGRQYGSDGSLAQGTRVVRQFLVNAGVQPDDFFFFDGSGMSAQDVITPRAFTQLLRYIADQSWGDQFRSTLPIGGVDGSLSGRFLSPPLVGHVFAKTGTLREVNSLSGYVTARSGHVLAFSILCNQHSPRAADPTHTIDAIVTALAAAN